MGTPSASSCDAASSKSNQIDCPTGLADVHAHVAVIGAGAVGLATGAYLARILAPTGRSVVVLDKERHVGAHSSSRNSEVIHAGLYYPADSLKTRLCLRGKELLYQFCRDHGVSHAPCGKWVVGGDSEHAARTLGAIETHAARFGIPLERVDLVDARREQPNLSRSITRVLSSPSTGIVASHEYMDRLAQLAGDTGAGYVTTGAKVENVAFNAARDLYRLTVRNADDDGESWTLDAHMVVNAAGVWSDRMFRAAWTSVAGPDASKHAPDAADPLHPLSIQMYPTRGRYFKLLRNQSVHHVHRLLYPVPDANLTSLGVHATVDLQGAAKFGPDVEFLPVDAREDYRITEESDSDRMKVLRARFHAAISQYLDGIEVQDLEYDYCGIRAKVTPPGTPARDFYIDRADLYGLPRWVNAIGVESPGLTSSLAVGEYIAQLLGVVPMHEKR
ncbi:hypothetical protein AMAG_07635 [Allomyces macrogynus ATCC 38327]|uniref:L-2-hydroxyglutarate dehydrogenase, mitochondrial n=1 Tax=Allomyces macrogynus (strain ATCC 38327) TaxID=578462 RepID=A0A0L0SIT0_ALLM3|nr:hypothetical protein AMAG_07635 [Allomyces macrogynus ATCC 38327]|eukprot:KNE62413.1 hypothetical protein AMAG_07635 [Allomyces macrogynus ATCC 38327]